MFTWRRSLRNDFSLNGINLYILDPFSHIMFVFTREMTKEDGRTASQLEEAAQQLAVKTLHECDPRCAIIGSMRI